MLTICVYLQSAAQHGAGLCAAPLPRTKHRFATDTYRHAAGVCRCDGQSVYEMTALLVQADTVQAPLRDGQRRCGLLRGTVGRRVLLAHVCKMGGGMGVHSGMRCIGAGVGKRV